MSLDNLPLAPDLEPAADGWVPGQPLCREISCPNPRDGFNQHCAEHQTKREAAPVDWNAVRQSGTPARRRGRRRQ